MGWASTRSRENRNELRMSRKRLFSRRFTSARNLSTSCMAAVSAGFRGGAHDVFSRGWILGRSPGGSQPRYEVRSVEIGSSRGYRLLRCTIQLCSLDHWRPDENENSVIQLLTAVPNNPSAWKF